MMTSVSGGAGAPGGALVGGAFVETPRLADSRERARVEEALLGGPRGALHWSEEEMLQIEKVGNAVLHWSEMVHIEAALVVCFWGLWINYRPERSFGFGMYLWSWLRSAPTVICVWVESRVRNVICVWVESSKKRRVVKF